MRALAILGPNAGETDLVPFRAAGTEIVAVETLEQTSAQQPAHAVLVLGGDGTVQRHLASLVKTQIPLLVVPTGSANDFARALGVRTRAAALRAWKAFLRGGRNVRSIDLGLIEFAGEGARATTEPTYFCCAAGAGVDAEVARRANSLPSWLRGRGGYFLAAIPALLRFRAQLITLTSSVKDGPRVPTISELGILVAVANSPWYGHGMNIAPQAELDDGRLEVCFVRGIGKLRLLRLFPKVYGGTHVGLREVEYFRAQRLRIESESGLAVHADGELVGRTPMDVSVAPGALRVIV
jgi:diacylglycerol kinase (ATP)